jgi:hypothetical protein
MPDFTYLVSPGRPTAGCAAGHMARHHWDSPIGLASQAGIPVSLGPYCLKALFVKHSNPRATSTMRCIR